MGAPKAPPFVQIAVVMDSESDPWVFGLDKEGRVWRAIAPGAKEGQGGWDQIDNSIDTDADGD